MFTVLWAPEALDEPAAISMQAGDRSAMNATVSRIDQRLRRDPADQGESRNERRRILLEAPLGGAFAVQSLDRIVAMLTVWRFDRRP